MFSFKLIYIEKLIMFIMEVNFIIRGRLGNAIFRYLACTIICLRNNGVYCVGKIKKYNMSDECFIKYIENGYKLTESVNMVGFYQHDDVYKNHKKEILTYMRCNTDHYIITDGKRAGDRNYETFYIKELLYTPDEFKKRYDTVLHIRLEDYVTHNLVIPIERIYELFNNTHISDDICIVSSNPTTDYEKQYISSLFSFFKNKNITCTFESNDVLTDFYIMKEAKILICSRSTIAWCAAFLSNKIEKCYFAVSCYNDSNTVTYKSPINNTVLY